MGKQTTANDLRRGMCVKVGRQWRKIHCVTVFQEVIAVAFCNGDSIRWEKNFAVEAK